MGTILQQYFIIVHWDKSNSLLSLLIFLAVWCPFLKDPLFLDFDIAKSEIKTNK
jgi:hypothetical protein